MKATRQQAILRLVSEETIQTQDELIARLGEMGYCVTQATVSRDIRQLKLTKVPTGQGTYRYMVPNSVSGQHVTKINETLLAAVTKTDHVGNIVVITTYPGMAQAVAAGVDQSKTSDILGCVAGDDTIIVITRSEQAACEFCADFVPDKLRG
ncbi:MAG: arginine repressor [Clostridia bacterium]|nr:arginine repressor [Clostridia bacterium]